MPGRSGGGLRDRVTGHDYASRHHMVAARPGRPVSTVQCWLRQVLESHSHWLYEQAVHHAFRLKPDILVRFKEWPSLSGWSRNGPPAPGGPWPAAWILIGYITQVKLLSPPPLT